MSWPMSRGREMWCGKPLPAVLPAAETTVLCPPRTALVALCGGFRCRGRACFRPEVRAVVPYDFSPDGARPSR
jgi:hypothetical protein